MIKPNFTGTLNDTAIKEFCQNALLVKENYNEKNVHQACYELTASNIYYDLENSDNRIDIEEEGYGYILIKPQQSIVIITNEELDIPNYILGRILSKGKLFSLGLLPVNTYADPGFKGNLGIVFHNTSTNFLKIKKFDEIAKIEFSVLHEEVKSTYSGQHGYKTESWPILNHYILKDEEIKKDKRIGKTDAEMERMYGKRYSQVIVRLLRTERKLLIAAFLYFLFNLLIIGASIYFSILGYILMPVTTVLLGLVTNVLAGLFLFKWGK